MKLALGIAAIAALIVGLLFLQGTFDTSKVGPGTEVEAPETTQGLGGNRVVAVETRKVPVYSEAVGTVRSRRTTRVSPRLMGTILTIAVKQGDAVAKDDLIATIDDREVAARLAAARADLVSAEAALTQAQAAWERTRQLHSRDAATKEQLEGATARHDSAKAAVAGAKEAVNVAEVVAGYAEIRAPVAGVVAERFAEPGDLALPGRPLLTIQDPNNLRLEADVREYLIAHLAVGGDVVARFDAPLSVDYETIVDERAPEADPATRTFLVKAALPADAKVRPGNFGRLRFRTGEREVLLVPAAAVRKIGQLETVHVVEEGDRVLIRHVRTGRAHRGAGGDTLEVLSGLARGERVVAGE
ncbi:MAG: efflux RND transporter periplasmic adaptor subunit [Planctomycetota bacterium]